MRDYRKTSGLAVTPLRKWACKLDVTDILQLRRNLISQNENIVNR